MEKEIKFTKEEECIVDLVKGIMNKIKTKGLVDYETNHLATVFMEAAKELSDLILETDGAKTKEEDTIVKKEPLVRYVDLVILNKLMNNFIRIKNVHSDVFIQDNKLNINFIYSGDNNTKSIIDCSERLKLINWEVFAGQIKFHKLGEVNNGILASFNTSKENNIFKAWAKNQLLDIIQHKYPDDEIEIRFLFDD